MLQRFDRQRAAGGYFRLGFVSALTVLDAEDSYLTHGEPLQPDIAEWTVWIVGRRSA